MQDIPVHTLEMTGLLKTILYLVLFYYLSKFLMRRWLNKKIKEHTDFRQNSVSEQEAAQRKNQEGKVTIKGSGSGNTNGGHSSDEGEFVDYEEVK